MKKVVLALCCALFPLPSGAQDYPHKPITLVVGYTPGGSNDVVARIVGPKMGEILGQPVVIENRPGANATMATHYVAKSAPDGYTLMVTGTGPMAIGLATFPSLPYDPLKDFALVNTAGLTPEVLALHPAVPAKTLKELVALSKTKQVSLSSSGSGGLPHLAIELLKNVSKGDFLHVPYKGAAPAITDTIAGHVNGVIMDLPPLMPQIKQGKLRAIAVANRQRISLLPEVATSGEQGYADVQAVNWFGVIAPRGTPAAVVAKLNDVLMKTVAQAQVKEKFVSVGVDSFTQASPEGFRKFLEEEITRWVKIARDAGAKVQPD